jgi:RNA recognition motif-containing protein
MKVQNKFRVFIAPIARSCDNAALIEFFNRYDAKVSDVFIPVDHETGRQKLFAFVSFFDEESYEAALSLDGYEWNLGRPLRIAPATERPGR